MSFCGMLPELAPAVKKKSEMMSEDLLANIAGKAPNVSPVSIAYMVFGVGALLIYNLAAEGEFSGIFTVSVMLQCFALSLLALQILSSGTAAGISMRAISLDALGIFFRLCSTTWLQGYLPTDASGDWLFQSLEICSLLVCLWLIYRIHGPQQATYQKEQDAFPSAWLIFGSLVIGTLFHADMNDRPLFDTLWMAGLYIGVVAVLPHLWLIMHTGGKVEALTSHYIAMMALSRAVSGIFMWHASEDITCEPWVEGVNHAPFIILTAHAVHLVLLADYAFIYVKAVSKQGIQCQLDLTGAAMIV